MWLWLLIAVALIVVVGSEEAEDAGEGGGLAADWATTMASEMATFENANPAYNNPLAIQGTGDTGTTAGNGLGIFTTAEAGLAAGISLLESYAARFPGLTITQALSRWTTGNSDPSQLSSDQQASVNNEAGMVGDALGVDPNQTTLGDLAGTDDDESGDP